jgi:hypothetical protein
MARGRMGGDAGGRSLHPLVVGFLLRRVVVRDGNAEAGVDLQPRGAAVGQHGRTHVNRDAGRHLGIARLGLGDDDGGHLPRLHLRDGGRGGGLGDRARTLRVRDLFHGALPLTGVEPSPTDPLSQPGGTFPSCGGTTASSPGSAAAVGVPLDALSQQFLRAAHSGQPLPPGAPSPGSTRAAAGAPSCASSGAEGPASASGYRRGRGERGRS